MTEKLDEILLNNRNKLKELFFKLTPSKEGWISLSDLTNFLKNVRIYPVINTKDLISAPDLNKLLKRLSSSSNITFTKFELIIKLIAEQSFDPSVSISERVKMFIIHIRNYVKMNYQVSLPLNSINKLLIKTQNCRNSNQSTSPARLKNSFKSLTRTNSISKGKFSDILNNNWIASKKTSPSLSHVKTNKNSSLNSTKNNDALDRKKCHRSSSSNPSKRNIKKLIFQSFKNFKSRHENFTKKLDRKILLKKHEKFISKVRVFNFSAAFMKSILFNAWKGLVNA